jgi:hypothetical protein
MALGDQEGAVSRPYFVGSQPLYGRWFTLAGENYQDLPFLQSGRGKIIKFLNFFGRGAIPFGDGKKRIPFPDYMI